MIELPNGDQIGIQSVEQSPNTARARNVGEFVEAPDPGSMSSDLVEGDARTQLAAALDGHNVYVVPKAIGEIVDPGSSVYRSRISKKTDPHLPPPRSLGTRPDSTPGTAPVFRSLSFVFVVVHDWVEGIA